MCSGSILVIKHCPGQPQLSRDPRREPAPVKRLKCWRSARDQDTLASSTQPGLVSLAVPQASPQASPRTPASTPGLPPQHPCAGCRCHGDRASSPLLVPLRKNVALFSSHPWPSVAHGCPQATRRFCLSPGRILHPGLWWAAAGHPGPPSRSRQDGEPANGHRWLHSQLPEASWT